MLERWFLIHTYLKTVEGQLPDNWQQFEKESLPSRLYKSEILLNYFQLERSKLLICIGYPGEHLKYPQGFKTTNAYKSALASYRRSYKSLNRKGYINGYYKDFRGKITKCSDWGSGSWITLTKFGKVKAEQLINANIRRKNLMLAHNDIVSVNS